LADHAPEWDIDARRVFGLDNRIGVTDYLALSMWLLGDVDCARRLIEQAVEEAQQLGQALTIAHTYNYKTILEAFRGDAVATMRAAGALVETARKVPFYEAFGRIMFSWARARHLDPAVAAELGQTLTRYLERLNTAVAPLCYGLKAELEGLAGRDDDALESVDAGALPTDYSRIGAHIKVEK
jgi:hypothetical protein